MSTRYPDGVQEPRQRGRPRVAERKHPVMTTLPTGIYDQICRQALAEDVKLSAFVRSLIVMRLTPPE